MTDSSDKKYFTKEKQEKALGWINEKWKPKKTCEICGESDWIVQDFLSVPVRFEGNISIGGGPISPNITVICKNCGNTKLFNAAIAGVLEVQKQKKDGDAE